MQTFSINQWNCKSTFQAVPWHVSIIFINVFIVNVAVISPVKLQHVALKVIFVFAADHVSCCRRPPCRFQGRRRCEGGSGSRSPPAENNQHMFESNTAGNLLIEHSYYQWTLRVRFPPKGLVSPSSSWSWGQLSSCLLDSCVIGWGTCQSNKHTWTYSF